MFSKFHLIYWSRTHKTCIWLVHKSGLRYLRTWEPLGGGALHHEFLPSALDHGQSEHLKRAGIKSCLLPASLPPISLLSSGDPANTNQQVYCSFFVISLFCKINHSCRLPSELKQKKLNRCLLLDPFCQGPLPVWSLLLSWGPLNWRLGLLRSLVLSRKTVMNLSLSLWLYIKNRRSLFSCPFPWDFLRYILHTIILVHGVQQISSNIEDKLIKLVFGQ